MVDPAWEEVVESIDSLVMDAVESDSADLASVVKIHDKLIEIAAVVFDTPYAGIGEIAQKTAELAMSIVLQEAEDPAQALDVVVEATSTLQCMAREVLNDRSPAYVPIPDALGLNAEELFATREIDAEDFEEEPLGLDDTITKPMERMTETGEHLAEEIVVSSPTPAKTKDAPLPNYPQFEMGSLTSSHLDDFLSEMDELITRAESLLMTLEKAEQQSVDAIQELLGVFHTVKGVSGILKLKSIIDLAHEAEVLLEEASHLSAATINLLFNSVDVFKAYSRSLHSYRDTDNFLPVPQVEPLIAKLKEVDLVTPPKHKPKQSKAPELKPQVVASDKPAKPTTAATKPAPPKKARQTVPAPVETSQIETGKLATEKLAIEDEDRYLKSQQHGQEEVKIKTNRLDALIDAIGELVISQSMIENDPEISRITRAQTVRNISTMSKICRQLQELAMGMRMVTIQATFHTMKRMVRDLASEQDKDIDVMVSGEHTELDRNIIEAMYNPLVHIVRNAIDHGIETAAERVKKGKKEKATIYLKAYHRGGNIVIEIADDGQGLDRDKILQEAVKRGILEEDEQYPDEVIWQTIFTSGFSTAQQVTAISGRGVGLDVVKKSIARFRGIVDVSGKKDQGTIFRISLPLTLAIIDGMLVKIGAERYIIPLTHIEEFIRIAPEQIATVANQGQVIKLREQVIPVFSLQHLLRVCSTGEEHASIGVIVSWEGKRCCLLVNELLSQQQVVIKTLGDDFNKLTGISGAAILGDGRVGMILDVQNILSMVLNATGLAG